MEYNEASPGPAPEHIFILEFSPEELDAAERAISDIDVNHDRRKGMRKLGDDYRDFEVLGRRDSGIAVRAYPCNEATLRKFLPLYVCSLIKGYDPWYCVSHNW
jgi:hypothetical protein